MVLRRGRQRLLLLLVLVKAAKGLACVLADNVLALGADAKMSVCQKPKVYSFFCVTGSGMARSGSSLD